MYAVVLSICDPILHDQVCNTEVYEEIENKQDMYLKKYVLEW